MGLARQRSAAVRPSRGRDHLAHDPPQAPDEARHPFERLFRELHVLIGRRDEQHRQPHRIGAVLFDKAIGPDHVALRLRHLRAAVLDPAVPVEARERLAEADETEIRQRLLEEARVDHVHRRVVDPALVVVHRAPVVDELALEGRAVVVRVAVAQEVPRRVDEGVHGLGLAPSLATTRGALHAHPLLLGLQRRLSLREVVLDLRQDDRQLGLRHRDCPTSPTMDDRDRTAPVALAGEPPVAQAEADREPRRMLLLQPLDDRAAAFRRGHPGELPRVHQPLVLGMRDERPLARDVRLLTLRNDDRLHRYVELLGEGEVPLVVRRHRHDRPRPVLHQHVVGNPDRNLLAGRRVGRVAPGEDAGLLALGVDPLHGRLPAGPLYVLEHLVGLRRPLDQLRDQLVLGREDEEGRAEDRVRPRRENRHVDVQLLDPEDDLGALGAADPVALHGDDALGPLQPLEVEHLVGVGRRPEEPLLQLAGLDQGAAALAAAVLHLLVRQDRLVVRAPVHRRGLAIGKARLVQLQEQPLRPAVVLRQVGRELAVPVDRPADPFHEPADVLDVALGHLPRRTAAADRRVLGRQAEGVPAHRAHHLTAIAPLEVRADVAERVDEHVTHVERSRRVGQLLEDVALVRVPGRSRRRIRDRERARLVPGPLPFRLDLVWVVPFHFRPPEIKKTSLARGRREAGAAPPRSLPALLEELLH